MKQTAFPHRYFEASDTNLTGRVVVATLPDSTPVYSDEMYDEQTLGEQTVAIFEGSYGGFMRGGFYVSRGDECFISAATLNALNITF